MERYYLCDTHWSIPQFSEPEPDLWFNGGWVQLTSGTYQRYAVTQSQAIRIQQTLTAQGEEVWVLNEADIQALLD